MKSVTATALKVLFVLAVLPLGNLYAEIFPGTAYNPGVTTPWGSPGGSCGPSDPFERPCTPTISVDEQGNPSIIGGNGTETLGLNDGEWVILPSTAVPITIGTVGAVLCGLGAADACNPSGVGATVGGAGIAARACLRFGSLLLFFSQKACMEAVGGSPDQT